MIVEGYSLHLYCDGDHTTWEKQNVYYGEYGGRNKKEAWGEAIKLGWSRSRDKVLCPECTGRIIAGFRR